jgi:hypothetical protein
MISAPDIAVPAIGCIGFSIASGVGFIMAGTKAGVNKEKMKKLDFKDADL